MRFALPFALLLAFVCAPAMAGNTNARQMLARADAAFVQGQPRTAKIELLNATAAEPGNAVAWMYLARVCLALSDGPGTEDALDRALALGYARGNTLHFRAHALLLEGKPQQAFDTAAPDAVAPGFRGYAARMRARALAMLGDTAGAAREFGAALAMLPKDTGLWMDVSRFRMATGEQAGAIEASGFALRYGGRNAAALVLKGILVRDQYGLRAALPWFDKALAIDRFDIDAQLERAATLGEMGWTNAMLKQTRDVLVLDPDNARAFYLQAAMAARARNFGLARTLLQRTGGVFDTSPAMVLLRAVIAYQEGNVQEAIDGLSGLLDQQPNNAKVRRLLAAAQWQAADSEAVVATLTPLADQADADSYALTLIGRAYEALGYRDTAAAYLDRAALYPRGFAPLPVESSTIDELRAAALDGDAAHRASLIRALLMSGAGEEALAQALSLQRDNPGAPDAYVLVGDVLDRNGRYAEAAETYRRAANLRFSEAVALRLVDTLRKGGQPLAAQQVLLLFVQQNPANVPARLLYADMMMARGSFLEAGRTLERIHRQRGYADVATTNNLAWCYFGVQRPLLAEAAAKRAYAMTPANASVSNSYGWLIYRTGGNRNDALALLVQARDQAPGWRSPTAHMEQILADRHSGG